MERIGLLEQVIHFTKPCRQSQHLSTHVVQQKVVKSNSDFDMYAPPLLENKVLHVVTVLLVIFPNILPKNQEHLYELLLE